MSVSQMREQSRAEEIANSVSHAFGLMAAFVGAPFLILNSARHDNRAFMVGASIFCATIVFLYLASTLYHVLPRGKAKHVFRLIEHSAIFLLIAGTYTPFTLGVLHGVWGWTLLAVIWGLAILGVLLKAYYQASLPVLFTCLYLLMGWLIVVAIDPLIDRVPTEGLLLLLGGGLAYTVGVAFFATDSRLKYGHFIWHLCVIAGTMFHYFAVLWYAA